MEATNLYVQITLDFNSMSRAIAKAFYERGRLARTLSQSEYAAIARNWEVRTDHLMNACQVLGIETVSEIE